MDPNNYREPISSKRVAAPQIMAVCIKNLLLFGYSMIYGFPTIAIPALQGEGRFPDDQIRLTQSEISWFSSVNLICVPIGCIFSGIFCEYLGRKKTLLFVTVPLIAGWLLFYFSTSTVYLYIALCMNGLSGGMLDTPAHIYVGEITQPHIRGRLAASGTIWVVLGTASQYFMGIFLSWRSAALVNLSIPMISAIFLLFIPESPYWLIQNKKYETAKKSLMWLRGWVTVQYIMEEYETIRQHLEKADKVTLTVREKLESYFSSNFLRPFFLVCFAFFMTNFCGNQSLQTYAITVFTLLKTPIDPYYATFILGLAQLCGTLVCIMFVHRTGKRVMVFTSAIGCALCFLASALIIHFGGVIDQSSRSNMTIVSGHYTLQNESLDVLIDENGAGFDDQILRHLNSSSDNLYDVDDIDKIEPSGRGWSAGTSMAFLLAGTFFAAYGIIAIPWMLIGEVFPQAYRSTASGLSIGTGHIFAFAANKLFLDMENSLTLAGTFGVYAVIGLCGSLVMFYILPETEGRSLQEIEAHFTGGAKLSKKKASRKFKSNIGAVNQSYIRDDKV